MIAVIVASNIFVTTIIITLMVLIAYSVLFLFVIIMVEMSIVRFTVYVLLLVLAAGHWPLGLRRVSGTKPSRWCGAHDAARSARRPSSGLGRGSPRSGSLTWRGGLFFTLFASFCMFGCAFVCLLFCLLVCFLTCLLVCLLVGLNVRTRKVHFCLCFFGV